MCDKGRDFLLRRKIKNKIVFRDLQWKLVKDRIDRRKIRTKV